MPISTITSSTQISAILYNNVQAQLEQVIEDFWGGDARSLPVVSGNIIDQRYWDEMADDVNRAWAHIKNRDFDQILGPEVNTGTVIFKDFFNHLITATNFIAANTSTVHPAQTLRATTATGAAESTRISTFGSTVTHVVSYNFTTTSEAQYFFNLGGSLIGSTGYGPPDFVPIISTDSSWINMITWINTELQKQANHFTYTNYYNDIDIVLNTTTNVDIGGVLYPYYTLDARFDRISSTSVQFTQVFGQIGYMSDLDIYSTATYSYSIGDGAFPGFESVRPELVNVQDLGSGGALVAFPTKYLVYTEFAGNFTWAANKVVTRQSSTKSITLTNAGNRNIIISDIIYSAHGKVTPYANYSTTVTFPYIMTPGQTLTINLYYKGITEGIYNNSITVITDAYFGNKTIGTVCEITPAEFEAEVNITNWTATTNSILPIRQAITVIPREFAMQSCYLTLTGNSGIFGYYFNSPQGIVGAIEIVPENYVPFQPPVPIPVQPGEAAVIEVIWEPFYRSTGSYSGAINIAIQSVAGHTLTKTINLSVSYTEPAYQNLGSWLSPQAKYNAVVGISYDLINSDRYLTIGVGMGSNGAPTVINGGSNYASVGNLGPTVDPNYAYGSVLYAQSTSPADQTNAEGQAFAAQWGAWINETGVYPVETEITRSYGFNMPIADTVTITFIMRDAGWIGVNGTKIADYTIAQEQVTYGDWDISYIYRYEKNSISVYLNAGYNYISFAVTNKGNDESKGLAAILIQQSNGNIVWSTRSPVRPYAAYPYWKSVYRIPLDGSARTYNAGNYCVKDPQSTYGNLLLAQVLGGGALMTINDDGFGNLSFNFSSKSADANNEEDHVTLINFPYLQYYYVPWGERVVNLPDGIGNGVETLRFYGFDRFGNVQATRVPIPASPKFEAEISSDNSGDRNLLGWGLVIVGSYLVATGVAVVVGGGLIGLGLLAIFKIICTKMYRLGLIPKDIFEADQKFGKYLIENDPDVYTGYIGWAEIMVNWMDGQGKGPKLWKALFWIKDEQAQIKKWRDWIIKYTCYGGIPWAEEMARRMGVRETSPLAGKFMMTVGLPICRTIGKFRRWFGEPKNPPGVIKGLTLLTVLNSMYVVVFFLKLIDKIKNETN